MTLGDAGTSRNPQECLWCYQPSATKHIHVKSHAWLSISGWFEDVVIILCFMDLRDIATLGLIFKKRKKNQNKKHVWVFLDVVKGGSPCPCSFDVAFLSNLTKPILQYLKDTNDLGLFYKLGDETTSKDTWTKLTSLVHTKKILDMLCFPRTRRGDIFESQQSKALQQHLQIIWKLQDSTRIHMNMFSWYWPIASSRVHADFQMF